MTAAQRKMNDAIVFPNKAEYQQMLHNSIMITKINDLEDRVQNIEGILVRSERTPSFLLNEKEERIPFESYKKSINEREKSVSQGLDSWQMCEEIVNRALEILYDWKETNDIRIQIQYASVIVGKIDNLKNREIISSDEVRKKICTLLRNVIRLNFDKELFTGGQIAALVKGFSLIIERDIQKETLFLLNEKLLKEGLLTMPAWE